MDPVTLEASPRAADWAACSSSCLMMDYRATPRLHRDLAEMAVRVALDTDENTHVDAVGPEKLRFPDFINVLKTGIGARALSLAVPWLSPRVVYQIQLLSK